MGATFVFDERAAMLNADAAGPKDTTHAGEVRAVKAGKETAPAVLVHARRSWVAVWVYYAEAGIWAKGTRPLAEWESAKPCALPEGVEVPTC